jgi:hypothetical protein
MGKVKARGKTHAIIGTERAVAHLDPTSITHARDRLRMLEERHKLAGAIVATSSPTEPMKYPSLQGGVLLAANGCELASDMHSELLTRIRDERGSYYTRQRRPDGREYNRKRKTQGLKQLAISFRPDHALAFSRLDHAGYSIRDVVIEFAKMLGVEFARLTSYEYVAAQVHPEEGSLHAHIAYATVDESRALLHPTGGKGRKGLRLAGPSVIGTLRLVDGGIWPDSDGDLARSWLAARRDGGEEPVDYALSQYIDGLAEKSLIGLSHGDATAKALIDEAISNYAVDARSRRAERIDVQAEKLTELQTRNDDLGAGNAALATRNQALELENARLREELLARGDDMGSSRRVPKGLRGIGMSG